MTQRGYRLRAWWRRNKQAFGAAKGGTRWTDRTIRPLIQHRATKAPFGGVAHQQGKTA